MRRLILILTLIPLVVSAQYNPYFSRQENNQMQKERDRWMSNLEDYARQPNTKFSSSSSQFNSYLKNLEAQSEADQQARESAENQRLEAMWKKWEVNAAIERERKAEADRIAYQKRIEELNRNTSVQKGIINQLRDRYKDQLIQNNPQAFALMGIVSYPILPISRMYFEKAFQKNPTEYAVLVAVSDFLNNPFPDYQNEYFRVIKIAELSSQEGYIPFRMYSCVLIQKSLEKIRNQNVTKKALAYAEKRLEICLNGLPTVYRTSSSYQLLVSANVHFQPATKDFWKDTQEGLDSEALKEKLNKMPFLGSPTDFFQNMF